MKVLFICNYNKHRSKTAEVIFTKEYTTKSAGLYNLTPVTEEQLLWADVVVVMEEAQRAELGRRFPKAYLKKRIVSLSIANTYERNQPELIKLLKERMLEIM